MGIQISPVKVSLLPGSNQGYGQGLAGLYASMVLAQGGDSASPISASPTSSQVVAWTEPLPAAEAPEVVRARERAARGRENAAAALLQARAERQTHTDADLSVVALQQLFAKRASFERACGVSTIAATKKPASKRRRKLR